MLIDKILKVAASLVDEAEVMLVSGTGISADLKRQDIAIGSLASYSGIVIRTITDGRIGVSSSDDPASWKACLDAAIHSARLADPVDWKGLPGPAPLETKPLAYDPKVRADPGLLNDLLDRMHCGAQQYPDAGVTSGSVSLGKVTHTIANTNDLVYETTQTHVSLGLEMISGQSTGFESDSSWELSRIDPEHIGETAAFFASKGKSGEEIKTGTYDIVLSPMAISHLLDAAVIPALSGRNVHTGRSYFAGKLRTAVAGSTISLYDDPFDPRGAGNCAWDGEGTPVRRVDYIRDGILSSFAYDLRTAYRYGAEPTGSATRGGQGGAPSIGFHNLILAGKEKNLMEDNSLYIHDLIGAHTANPMSGDFSVELSSPFIIEGGELARPVRTGMLSGNIFSMLHEIDGCSRETRTFGSLIVPSVAIRNAAIVGRA